MHRLAASDITLKLIDIIPTLLWIGLVLVVVFLFRDVIQQRVLPRLEQVEVLGVKASFIKEELDRASTVAPAGDEADRTQVARRSERLASLIEGARVLLVNDVPLEMRHVVSLLESLQMTVAIATSTHQALTELEVRRADVVISDMRRGDDTTAGLALISSVRQAGVEAPVILTVGRYEPELGVPGGAFGITNRVDELLNLVFDALERVRG